MSLSMIGPKNETEDLLLCITQTCEMLNKQIYKKPQENLELKLTKPTEQFHFKPPIPFKDLG